MITENLLSRITLNPKDKLLSQELENEDLEFVRACRGRLAKQLQTADD